MRRNITNIVLILCFAAVLVAVPIWSAIEPDIVFSATENRLLQEPPKIEGLHMTVLRADCEAYVVDRLPQREALLAAYSKLQLGMGNYMVRNLYVTDDNWILPREYERGSAELEKYASAVRQTARAHPQTQFCYLMVPFKTGALYRFAPQYVSNAYAEDNRADLMARMRGIENLLPVDAVQYFGENCTVDELRTMYYKTDFHWNAVGAQKAADFCVQTLCERGILSTPPEDLRDVLTMTHEQHAYAGDLNRQLSGAVAAENEIARLRLKDASQVRYFESVGDEKPAARGSIIGAGEDKSPAAYNDLYTENRGYYRIENPAAREKKSLLLLKDSFQNPLTDYFTALFSEVTVIDPRYYKEPYSFDELLEAHPPDLVLYLYHQSNFSPELISFLKPKK